MIKVSINKVAEYCNGRMNDKAAAAGRDLVSGASIDTRTLEAGNIFIPFKGENVDGHRFIENALSKGAAVSLTEAPLEETDEDHPLIHVEDGLAALQMIAKRHLEEVAPKVIAITGSNGKTTTKDMVECLLADDYKVKKTIGNYNNEIGLPLTLLELDDDTEISILEMGMDRTGDIHFLSTLTKPDIAIITNVGESHIEKLGSREKIAEAKYEITDGLKEGGVLIYSKDYPLLNELTATEDRGFKMISAGVSEENDHVVSHVSQNAGGTSFEVGGLHVDIPQLGSHNAMNATLSLLAVGALGEDMAALTGRFDKLRVSSMRMEQAVHSSGALIINDAYNASPSSMKSAVDTVAGLDYSKKILVMADILELGDYSETLHRSVGEHISSSGRDFKLLTFGTESKFIAEAAAGVDARHFDDIREVAGHLEEMLDEDTVVLLKGSRGMEMERVKSHIW
ncbi:UDP-N-acetylmuramoyl-tripeptide--D-alanyl-D-alanine ligase [Lacicoccus alkaliphilus]|uniref:UDP-N-acetylmuramoyl-tripeptide--D-alanyl-D-alanine ligase n=1 Tax=Lacicoccus alkaliphilus DSM 16010 TaxID=1123231 RepID=A0A1M7KFM8_9BACL|nr:UDP-N-acetylmuramoyl-tripeptide--D-alanyl-D-alanine ligase [Salinicoccus alkaliphilus]SHM64092.1 UDP-N-acetylmuramoyl-tripeptide--D-alanyl-D-alanine ligase [Salinicoccus alkaliphilus DSM 16010]